jgi:hypothetical protein
MFARIEPKAGQRWYQESQNGDLRVSTTGPFGGLVGASGGWGGDTLSFVFPYEIDRYNCPGATCDHMIAGSNRCGRRCWAPIPASSWAAISPNLTKQTLGNRSFINQLAFAPSNTAVALVGTNDGNVQYGFGLNTSPTTAVWGERDGVQHRAAQPAHPGRDRPSHGPHHRLRGRGRVRPEHPGYPWPRLSGGLHGQLRVLHLDQQERQPAQHPGGLHHRQPALPAQVFAGTDWGLLLHGRHHPEPPDLVPLPGRACPTP